LVLNPKITKAMSDNLTPTELGQVNNMVVFKQRELEERTKKRQQISEIATYTNGNRNHPLYTHIINHDPFLLQKDERGKFWRDYRTAAQLRNLNPKITKAMDNLTPTELDLFNNLVLIKANELEVRTRKRNQIKKIANYTNGDINHPLYIHIINLDPNLLQKDERGKFWGDYRTADELCNFKLN